MAHEKLSNEQVVEVVVAPHNHIERHPEPNHIGPTVHPYDQV